MEAAGEAVGGRVFKVPGIAGADGGVYGARWSQPDGLVRGRGSADDRAGIANQVSSVGAGEGRDVGSRRVCIRLPGFGSSAVAKRTGEGGERAGGVRNATGGRAARGGLFGPGA